MYDRIPKRDNHKKPSKNETAQNQQASFSDNRTDKVSELTIQRVVANRENNDRFGGVNGGTYEDFIAYIIEQVNLTALEQMIEEGEIGGVEEYILDQFADEETINWNNFEAGLNQRYREVLQREVLQAFPNNTQDFQHIQAIHNNDPGSFREFEQTFAEGWEAGGNVHTGIQVLQIRISGRNGGTTAAQFQNGLLTTIQQVTIALGDREDFNFDMLDNNNMPPIADVIRAQWAFGHTVERITEHVVDLTEGMNEFPWEQNEE